MTKTTQFITTHSKNALFIAVVMVGLTTIAYGADSFDVSKLESKATGIMDTIKSVLRIILPIIISVCGFMWYRKQGDQGMWLRIGAGSVIILMASEIATFLVGS